MSMYNKREFFNTYFANASEKSILVDLLDKRFNPSNHPLSILDLGCHDGALMKKIVSAYESRLPEKVMVTGVEPSMNAITTYKKTDFSKSVAVNVFPGTAEHYFAQNENYFDWVFASQCLYWSPDLPQMVKQISQAGDAGLIVLRGEQGIYEIQSHFKSYLGNPEEKFYTAMNIEQSLIKESITFEKETRKTSIHLPVKDSIEFKWLIAFLLQCDENELSKARLDEVQNWILARSPDEFTHEVCFFWLGKAAFIKEDFNVH